MSIEVFCKSEKTFSRREIAEFVENGMFFDEDPQFEPSYDEVEIDDRDWRFFTIHYETNKRPVMIERYANAGDVKDFVTETIEQVKAVAENSSDKVTMQLQNANQIFHFDFDPATLTDEAWEMMDALEAHLARTLNGIVYADEGVYDKDLQIICKFKA